MARESVIQHIPATTMVIIREDHIELFKVLEVGASDCPDYACSSAVLSAFEYWTNIKIGNRSQAKIHNQKLEKSGEKPSQDESLWIYKSQTELKENELLNIWGVSKVGQCLNWLILVNLLHSRNNPDYKWDRTIQYQLNIDFLNEMLCNLMKTTFFNSKECSLQNERIEVAQVEESTIHKTTSLEIIGENSKNSEKPSIQPENNEDFSDENSINPSISLSLEPINSSLLVKPLEFSSEKGFHDYELSKWIRAKNKNAGRTKLNKYESKLREKRKYANIIASPLDLYETDLVFQKWCDTRYAELTKNHGEKYSLGVEKTVDMVLDEALFSAWQKKNRGVIEYELDNDDEDYYADEIVYTGEED